MEVFETSEDITTKNYYVSECNYELNCFSIDNTCYYLSFFQTNIRSIGKNFTKLEVLLQYFDYCFDLIILTETWNCNTGNVETCNCIFFYTRL